MSATTHEVAGSRVAAAAVSPWAIALLVALAAFMEVLDTTVVNVVLPYIAGVWGSATTRRPGR